MGHLPVVRVATVVVVFFATTILANPFFRLARLNLPPNLFFLSTPNSQRALWAFGTRSKPPDPRLSKECFDWACLLKCAEPSRYTYEEVFPNCIAYCDSSSEEALYRLFPAADVCNRINSTNECYSYDCAKSCDETPFVTPIIAVSKCIKSSCNNAKVPCTSPAAYPPDVDPTNLKMQSSMSASRGRRPRWMGIF